MHTSHAKKFITILFGTIIFAFYIWLIGFRDFNAGGDTLRYVTTYMQLKSLTSAASVGEIFYGNTEILWWPLQSIIKSIGFGPRAWLVINSTAVFFLVAYAYHLMSKVYGFSWLIFPFVFLTYYAVYSGNTIRQAIAVPLVLAAMYFFFERKWLLGLPLLLLAIGLHWSAIFSVLILFFLVKFLSSRYLLLATPIIGGFSSALINIIISTTLSLMNSPELDAKYNLYFTSNHSEYIGSIWLSFNFWLCTLVSSLYLYIYAGRKSHNILLCSYTSFFLALILFGANFPGFSERFFPYILVALPAMVFLIFKSFGISATSRYLGLALAFGILGGVVFSTYSAKFTLGYSF